MCRRRCWCRCSSGWSTRFLSREGSYFSHTPAGEREVAAITDSWSTWLNEQLEKDRGRPRSAELRAAADTIAKRLLAEDLANGLPSVREKVGAGAVSRV